MDVAEAIASAIASRHLTPGTRLPSDRELAQKLGVSRPTVREGMLALEYAGLVEVRPGSGAYVNHPMHGPGASVLSAVDSPAQLIEARSAVEPTIARLCALREDDDHLAGILDLVNRAEPEVGEGGSPTELVRLGLEFHRALAASCGNEFLSRFCTSLVTAHDHPLWTLLNRQAMLTVEARRSQVDDHRRIAQSIINHDPDGAFEAMKTHLEQVSVTIAGVV
jgi:DNA-binding FadR family transcriptional regulator